ncbi:hypothetical protein [Nitrospirillum sp. BR 11163]|uniref:hypothetical protein n=1 Tax=Nitrospirillum sp. BR 11163 TaxID=3104323 RepID=UPI002AFFF809|nr:hypothetical protein [Nitrospirillum sp. BR 11163]MEA1674713.1 hypothetical protein [Nitrospirillum sp. BR 11163]
MTHDPPIRSPRLDSAAQCLTLDPGVQSFLDRAVEADLLPYAPGLDPAARQDIAARLQVAAPPPDGPVTRVAVPGAEAISVRLCRPGQIRGRGAPVVFYLHGGLWALGGWNTHGAAAAALARACGAALVFVDHGRVPAAQALKQARPPWTGRAPRPQPLGWIPRAWPWPATAAAGPWRRCWPLACRPARAFAC